MSLDNTINAYFVTTSSIADIGGDQAHKASKDMQNAINCLKEHIEEENIRQIKASEGFPLIASGKLSKKDVFVFDRFEGDFFQQLQQTKSLIVGPSCLITCLQNAEPIPLGTSPVYTNAMQNVNVSASGITPAEKERVKLLIEWMGGHYFQNLGRSITHLISNTIKSSKYEYATLNGIPVMHVNWVQCVWERSSTEYNIKATDGQFDKYILPVFFGINITCTGLKADKKNEIMHLVNQNGGTYHGAFRSQLVDIVITEKDKCNSDKYQAAVRFKKDILTPEWIVDSVQRGFALPTKQYQVKCLKVSTPTKADQGVPDFTMTENTQLSDISRISVLGSNRASSVMATTVNDTACSSMNDTQKPVPNSAAPSSLSRDLKKNTAGMHYRKIYEKICHKEAKKAGNFLDGCCIYLSGFHVEEKEKLNRILNVGGATRYDLINEKITHIIVGQLLDNEFNAWKKYKFLTTLHIVRLDWLLESIKLNHPASEAMYRVSLPAAREPDAPSPSSKQTLRSMNHSFKQPGKPIKKKLFSPETALEREKEHSHAHALTPLASSTELPHDVEEENLIAQYSQENQPVASVPMLSATKINNEPIQAPVKSVVPNPSDMASISQLSVDYENLDFFQGMSLYVYKNHFPDDFYMNLVTECEAVRGNVVTASFTDPVDYAVVSFERTLDIKRLPVKCKHIVTELYVESCMKDNKLVSIEYYHKHIPHTAESQPLTGMTVVVSMYSDLERDFIDSIAQLLGATVNKTFVKKEKPLLVCPSAKGTKYEGAIKWNYPVVTSAWLMRCAEEGTKFPFHDYLVEGSPDDFPTSPHLPTPKSCGHEVERDMNDLDCQMAAATVADICTPLRNKRVAELAGQTHLPRPSTGSNSNSPHTPINRPSYNFPYLEKIVAELDDDAKRECLKEVLEELRNNQTPELERIRRQACTPIQKPTPKGIPDFCTTPEFEKRMAAEFEKRWRLPQKKIKLDTPIEVVRRRVLKATFEAMGIPFNYDDDDRRKETPDVTPTATNNNTPLHHKSSTEHTMQPRSIFGQNIDTNGASSCAPRPSAIIIPNTQSPSGVGQRASLNGKSTINFDKLTFDESMLSDDGNASTSKSEQRSAKDTPEIKQITDYLRNCASRRQSLKRARANNQRTTLESETEAHYVQPFESEQLHSDEMVGWRDPAEFANQRRSKQTEPTMQYRGTPCFSISCSEEQTRDDIMGKILQLGGEICENLVNYDPECTHFLIERPNRAEKMLGCISSGKWILSLKYIEECFAKNVFIDEELYEWGNCKALNLPHLTAEEQLIAMAAHRWRKDLSSKSLNGEVGAFTGFRAILHLKGRNVDALKNVIRAGKGEVIEAMPPYRYSSCTKTVTHCFVDVKKSPLGLDDLEYFKRHHVLVLTQMYINAYLMNGPDVELSKYEIKSQ